MKKTNNLNNIFSDKTSGSSEILFKLNDFILSRADNLSEIKKVITISEKQLSSFEAVNNYLKKLQIIVDKRDKNELIIFAESVKGSFGKIYKNIYKNGRKYFQNFNYILTLSNSKTLFEVFSLWKDENKKLRIVIAESRPANEGKFLAKKLLKKNIKIEFITDAMVSLFIPEVDAVVIGADKILKNGNVVNKTGSKNLAVLCRFFKKPFYVISSKDKFSRKDYYKPELKDSKEIWNFSDKNLKVFNQYFEEIEKGLITKIITD